MSHVVPSALPTPFPSEEARALLDRARALQVCSPPTRQDAANLWDCLRAARKAAEAQKEQTCRPLKQAWEQAKAPFDAFIQQCRACETKLEEAMSAYDREQARLAAREQAHLQAKIERRNARLLHQAEHRGTTPVLHVAPVVTGPPSSLETASGAKQVRIARPVYRLRGVPLGEPLRATDPRAHELHTRYPDLFVLDWRAFQAAALSGLLDGLATVERTVDYIYQRRGGGGA